MSQKIRNIASVLAIPYINIYTMALLEQKAVECYIYSFSWKITITAKCENYHTY